MYKLFASAALAASTYAVEDYCCELYVGENFEGYMEEACLKQNWFSEYLDSYGYSFIKIGGMDNGQDNDPMNDSIGSYKCGNKVKADFCLEEPLKVKDKDNLTQYECNNLGFSSERGGAEDAGPLEFMNLISSIVLSKSQGRLTSTCA